ncbi:hypothetical protein [Brachybacterium sp. GPGPB12]|uniref:hypothetical protein n=1 Tax=Brachybacterium sp. GPGPB12 TaxID=3023517 RepID=UPI0031342E18
MTQPLLMPLLARRAAGRDGAAARSAGPPRRAGARALVGGGHPAAVPRRAGAVPRHARRLPARPDRLRARAVAAAGRLAARAPCRGVAPISPRRW